MLGPDRPTLCSGLTVNGQTKSSLLVGVTGGRAGGRTVAQTDWEDWCQWRSGHADAGFI